MVTYGSGNMTLQQFMALQSRTHFKGGSVRSQGSDVEGEAGGGIEAYGMSRMTCQSLIFGNKNESLSTWRGVYISIGGRVYIYVSNETSRARASEMRRVKRKLVAVQHVQLRCKRLTASDLSIGASQPRVPKASLSFAVTPFTCVHMRPTVDRPTPPSSHRTLPSREHTPLYRGQRYRVALGIPTHVRTLENGRVWIPAQARSIPSTRILDDDDRRVPELDDELTGGDKLTGRDAPASEPVVGCVVDAVRNIVNTVVHTATYRPHLTRTPGLTRTLNLNLNLHPNLVLHIAPDLRPGRAAC
ncbi:hypothetical protein RHS03_09876, partial [Rhizoctonia solani]